MKINSPQSIPIISVSQALAYEKYELETAQQIINSSLEILTKYKNKKIKILDIGGGGAFFL